MGAINSKSIVANPSYCSGEETWEDLVALDEHVRRGGSCPAAGEDDEESTNEDLSACHVHCFPKVWCFIKSVPSLISTTSDDAADTSCDALVSCLDDEDSDAARKNSVLPDDIYTRIWGFIADVENGNTLESTVFDQTSVTTFRLVNTAARNAFNLSQGWSLVARAFKRQAEEAISKIRVLNTERDVLNQVRHFGQLVGAPVFVPGDNESQAARSLAVTRELEECLDEIRQHVLPNVNTLVESFGGEAVAIDEHARIHYMVGYEEQGDDWIIHFIPMTGRTIRIAIG